MTFDHSGQNLSKRQIPVWVSVLIKENCFEKKRKPSEYIISSIRSSGIVVASMNRTSICTIK